LNLASTLFILSLVARFTVTFVVPDHNPNVETTLTLKQPEHGNNIGTSSAHFKESHARISKESHTRVPKLELPAAAGFAPQSGPGAPGAPPKRPLRAVFFGAWLIKTPFGKSSR
jgi:hypothetical protein